MKQFEHVVIGFGKAGKTLAGALAAAGKSVALIERSPRMYGGTCINVACIPTKTLEYSARQSAAMGGDFSKKAERYHQAVEEKRALVAGLRQKNYAKAVNAGVEVITGDASFLDAHKLQVILEHGEKIEITGEQIYINTGARPFLPPISGLLESARVYTSETLMELDTLPEQLIVIGGGYIGLEFASYYEHFGAKVTVIQDGDTFLPREDREVADSVLESLRKRGIQVIFGAAITSVADEGSDAVVTFTTKSGGEQKLRAKAVLAATGRRPDVEGLGLEAAGVRLTERGAVEVDEYLRTNVPHIWAMGDVTGGPQFTYISLDDSRIVKDQMLGDGKRTARGRGAVPYSVFLDPPFSRVGLTEDQALELGYDCQIARLPAAAVPKAYVLRQSEGMLKIIIDRKTGLILGAHFFCAESHEMINLVKLAMDNGIPYTVLRDDIYTHPTMSEALNDLLFSVQ